MSHTVTLEYPLSIVYPALSDSNQIERLQRLTPEAQHFTLLPSDHVRLPLGGLASFLGPTPSPTHPPNANNLPRPRTMDAVSDIESGHEIGEVIERAKFEFGGTVPLLFGLVNRPLSIAGAQIVDANARIVLFESGVAAQGIREVKLRTFEEIDLKIGDGDGTKKGTEVRETVWGTCPRLLSYLLKFIAPGVHKHHMEMYHKLFE